MLTLEKIELVRVRLWGIFREDNMSPFRLIALPTVDQYSLLHIYLKSVFHGRASPHRFIS
jgi:hypothetical protein